MGFNPMTLSQTVFHHIKYKSTEPIKFWFGWDSNRLPYQKIFSNLWNIKVESVQNSGFDGIQTHDLQDKIFFNLEISNEYKAFKF